MSVEKDANNPQVRPNRFTDGAGSRKHSIYEDPAIAQSAKEDPFARVVSQNWQSILTFLVVVAALTYAYYSFQNTQEAKKASLAYQFSLVREAYENFTSDIDDRDKSKVELVKNTDTAKTDELKKKLDENEAKIKTSKEKVERVLEALGDAQTAPYPDIVKLYQGLLALRVGDYAKAKQQLPEWSQDSEESPERFYAELAALSLGRGLLDNEESLPEAKKVLFDLSEKGSVAAASAGLALEASGTLKDDERQRLAKALQAIKTKFPEQEKFIAEPLARLTS